MTPTRPAPGGPVADYTVRVRRSTGWALLAVTVVIVIVAIAGFQSVARTSPGSDLRTTNLRVVPTLRSLTVSAAAVDFSSCRHGTPPRNSSKLALGFPNGRCYIGKRGKAYPIKIKNGLEARILVGSSNAVPSDGGRQWVPCTFGANAEVACAGPGKPGRDQFAVENFSSYTQNEFGLSKTMLCDREFGPSRDCIATTGQVQREGVILIGPSKPDDNSTTWTVTITWMAAPMP